MRDAFLSLSLSFLLHVRTASAHQTRNADDRPETGRYKRVDKSRIGFELD